MRAPLTIQTAADVYVAIAEANLVDFARMKLSPAADRPRTLVSDLAGPVVAPLPLTTPWRVVMVAESPGRLLENNDLLLNLNDPCAIEDTSWIKPGKVIREVTLTTAGGKACVDFAVRATTCSTSNSTPAGTATSTPTTPTRRPSPSIPNVRPGPLDLHEVIRYAGTAGHRHPPLRQPPRVGTAAGRDPAAVSELGHQGRQVRIRERRLAAVDVLAARGGAQGGRASVDGRRARRVSPHRLLPHLPEPDDAGRHRRRRNQPEQPPDA